MTDIHVIAVQCPGGRAQAITCVHILLKRTRTLQPPPIAQLGPLCRAFEQATGWQLRHEQAPAGLGEVWSTTIDGHGQPAGRLVLSSAQRDDDSDAAAGSIDLHQARPLALAIGGLLNEINQLRQAVWHRTIAAPDDFARRRLSRSCVALPGEAGPSGDETFTAADGGTSAA